MRGFILGLSVSLAFIVGCVAGSVGVFPRAASAVQVEEQRWAYFCFERAKVDEINDIANGAGMRGWEMVAAASGKGDGVPIWCFRQPRP
ncbi:MAG: hypothetical protein JW751_01550 [Polyangiaceae bacterium]|nr:hypothetical protein [Polyangiaceae bacterium]